MLQIKLNPRIEKLIDREIKAGRFHSPDQVIDKAVRNLIQHNRAVEDLRASLDNAHGQLERGEGIPRRQLTVSKIRENALRRFGDPRKKKAS